MSASAPLVLVVEDELPIRRLLRVALSSEGYRLAEADNGEAAMRMAARLLPDLVILDLGLPDLDGQQVIGHLRGWMQAPIIVLSARDHAQQKVMALDNGADDYLTKPFSVPELVARIRVALRHATRISGEIEPSPVVCGDLRIDLATRRVFVKDAEIRLTPIEYELLMTLVRHAGKVLTHSFLFGEVWGKDHELKVHHLRVFMANLRRKIETEPALPRFLLTEPGVGYRFAAE